MATDTQIQPPRNSRQEITLSFSVESETEAPARARRAIAALELALAGPVLHDLGVVVTELVANAVRFAPPSAIGVLIEVDERGRVFGEVTDGGRGKAALDRARALEAGGLGLQIVDALCARWGAESRPSRVWFEIEHPDDESQR